MKEQFFRPLECAPAGGVTAGHSAILMHTTHMMVIIHHNLWLYGFSSLIAEITFRWGIMNISQASYKKWIHVVFSQWVDQSEHEAGKTSSVVLRMSEISLNILRTKY